MLALFVALLMVGCGKEEADTDESSTADDMRLNKMEDLFSEVKLLVKDGNLARAERKAVKLLDRFDTLRSESQKIETKLGYLRILGAIYLSSAYEGVPKLELLDIADEIDELSDDPQDLSLVYRLKGTHYLDSINSEARKYFYKALAISKSNKKVSIEKISIRVGLCSAYLPESDKILLSLPGESKMRSIRADAQEAKKHGVEAIKMIEIIEDSRESRFYRLSLALQMSAACALTEQHDSRAKFLQLAEFLTQKEIENDPDSEALHLIKTMIELNKFSIKSDQEFIRNLKQIRNQSKKELDSIMQDAINGMNESLQRVHTNND